MACELGVWVNGWKCRLTESAGLRRFETVTAGSRVHDEYTGPITAVHNYAIAHRGADGSEQLKRPLKQRPWMQPCLLHHTSTYEYTAS